MVAPGEVSPDDGEPIFVAQAIDQDSECEQEEWDGDYESFEDTFLLDVQRVCNDESGGAKCGVA